MTRAARLAIVTAGDLEYTAFLKSAIATEGYDVTAYPDGRAFLEELTRSCPPDVALLEVDPSYSDGLWILKAALKAAPGLPVIMLSAQQDASSIVDAIRCGAFHYVVKGDGADGVAVSALVRGALGRRPPPAPTTPAGGCCSSWIESPSMQAVQSMIERVADSRVPVLITGESGVGKEVVARELHRHSGRPHKPFVKVNCAALPSELLETELFGHERGAFTGAHAARIGKFEFAHEGSLMLDEIGEMPQDLQAKLLHVLQDNTFTRVGSNHTIATDVRIIAATNRPMIELVRSGRFREDLYYRLQVIEIHVPPLRERPSEILPLVDCFLARYAAEYARRVPRPPLAMRDTLRAYRWPGNVRELENVIKRYVILQDPELVMRELQVVSHHTSVDGHSRSRQAMATTSAATEVHGPELATKPHLVDLDADKSLPALAREASRTVERMAIRRALGVYRWNRRKVARHLGVSYKTLLNKMKDCGITPHDHVAGEG